MSEKLSIVANLLSIRDGYLHEGNDRRLFRDEHTLTFHRKSQRYYSLVYGTYSSGIVLGLSSMMFSIVHRLAVSLLSTNETYYPLHIKMWWEPDVHRGVSFPRSNRKKSPKAQISTLVLSVITARKSRPNLSVSAKMCLTFWMSLLSPRLSLGSRRSSTIRCRWSRLFMQTRLHYTGHCLTIPFYCRKGDYHRYLAEFASGEKRKVAATAAHEAYKVYFA